MKFLTPDWPAPKHVKAYTTLRNSWGNKDLSFHSQDTQLQTLLKLPSAPIWLDQAHTAIVLPATEISVGQVGDAIYTSTPNHACTILTADCLPVFICNRQGTHVAIIHAGWRGLAAGIIENTLAALHQPAEELLVWLGPAIGPEKFEVGEDVYAAFTSHHPASSQGFTPYKPTKWLANLYLLAKLRLAEHGIQHIYGGQFCTYTQEELFYSYRRDGKTGRMAHSIWLETL